MSPIPIQSWNHVFWNKGYDRGNTLTAVGSFKISFPATAYNVFLNTETFNNLCALISVTSYNWCFAGILGNKYKIIILQHCDLQSKGRGHHWIFGWSVIVICDSIDINCECVTPDAIIIHKYHIIISWAEIWWGTFHPQANLRWQKAWF